VPYALPSAAHYTQPYQAYQGSYYTPYTQATTSHYRAPAHPYASQWSAYQYSAPQSVSSPQSSIPGSYSTPSGQPTSLPSPPIPLQSQSSSSQTKPPLQAGEHMSTSQAPASSPQLLQSSTGRSVYTAINHPSYAGYKPEVAAGSYAPPHSSTPPNHRSGASTPAVSQSSDSHPPTASHTPPAASSYNTIPTPGTKFVPTYTQAQPAVPATGISLKWQQPYSGPKTLPQQQPAPIAAVPPAHSPHSPAYHAPPQSVTSTS
jgi:hypothetical protein